MPMFQSRPLLVYYDLLHSERGTGAADDMERGTGWTCVTQQLLRHSP
jgi:hypothetical protein